MTTEHERLLRTAGFVVAFLGFVWLVVWYLPSLLWLSEFQYTWDGRHARDPIVGTLWAASTFASVVLTWASSSIGRRRWAFVGSLVVALGTIVGEAVVSDLRYFGEGPRSEPWMRGPFVGLLGGLAIAITFVLFLGLPTAATRRSCRADAIGTKRPSEEDAR